MYKKQRKRIYALYKGEINICDGTIREIAKKTGKSINCIQCCKSPSKIAIHKENAMELVFIGYEPEDEIKNKEAFNERVIRRSD